MNLKLLKWMQTKYVFSKISEKLVLTVALQIHAKINFKRLYKNLSYLFFMNFLPYRVFNIILAYFYEIETL